MNEKIDKLIKSRNRLIKRCNFCGKASLVLLAGSLVFLGIGKLGSKRVTKIQNKIYGLEEERVKKLNNNYETTGKEA